METVTLKCPSSALKKQDRIQQLKTNCKEWIYCEPISILIDLFDNENSMKNFGEDFESDLKKIQVFSQRWDFRKGKERWDVQDDLFAEKNKNEIRNISLRLDLTNHVNPSLDPNFILPLGGARRANYVRPLMASKIIDDQKWCNRTIVALSGTRPIKDIEKPYIKEYAKGAETEYEAICYGMEKAFSVNQYSEKKNRSECINSQSAIRRYEGCSNNNNLFCLAAPSSEPKIRRANSYDTFNYFLEKFNVRKGDALLLVTSCIYVPFQLLKFMDLAIENDFDVDCIGADPVDNYSLSNTSNYLQEIKGTIDAICMLMDKYK